MPIMSKLKSTVARFGRFKRERGGVAAIEFAIAAPLLVALLVGSVELTSGLGAQGKLTRAVESVGDILSQETEMDVTLFNTGTDAGPAIMFPMPPERFGVNVTSLIVCYANPADLNSERRYYVTWSRGRGVSPGALRGAGEQFTDIDQPLALAHGQTLILSEGIYRFQPSIARTTATEFSLRARALHLPRATDRIVFDGVEPDPVLGCDDYMP